MLYLHNCCVGDVHGSSCTLYLILWKFLSATVDTLQNDEALLLLNLEEKAGVTVVNIDRMKCLVLVKVYLCELLFDVT